MDILMKLRVNLLNDRITLTEIAWRAILFNAVEVWDIMEFNRKFDILR